MTQKKNTRWIIGIDEVGRGPLAGPVTVCALAMPETFLYELRRSFDSKKLSVKSRVEIFQIMRGFRIAGELDYRIVSISASMIDRKRIVPCLQIAIKRALCSLGPSDASSIRILLDGGLRAPGKYTNQQTIIRGDATVPIIGLASIVAKVHRDRLMIRQARRYPNWGFEKHKGYGTKAHYTALAAHGPSPLHRLSFLSNLVG